MRLDLHGFCDASAMAAVLYARVCRSPNEVHTALLCSKTEIAPLKRMTIPRLELLAAVMFTKLVSHESLTFRHMVSIYGRIHPHVVESPPFSLEGVYPKSALLHPKSPLEVHVRQDSATRGLSASELSNH